MKRGSGVLAHIASLPSRYGIGNLGESARAFIGRLSEAGQVYWQVMPCAHPSGDHNPYTPVSAFAHNPYLIDIASLAADGLLTESDCKAAQAEDTGKVDYKVITETRHTLLKKAYAAGIKKYQKEFAIFRYRHAYWIFDYALYVTIKRHQAGRVLRGWTAALLEREPEALMEFAQEYYEEIECAVFAQFLCRLQWDDLRAYAREKGVALIGELPFYVNEDSADAWVRPGMLLRDGSRTVPDGAAVERCVPFDWDSLREDGFQWWMARLGHWAEQFDCLYVDHLGDVFSYYRVLRNQCAEDGLWERGPGYDFNGVLRSHMPNVEIISGDASRPEQREFLRHCGFAQTKVLQLAFEENGEAHMPHGFERRCLCTISKTRGGGTRSWFLESDSGIKERLREYFGTFGPFGAFVEFGEDDVATKLMRAAMGSVADVCVIPMEDLLGLTDEEKLFQAGRKENWVWRMREGDFGPVECEKLLRMAKIYGRFHSAGEG